MDRIRTVEELRSVVPDYTDQELSDFLEKETFFRIGEGYVSAFGAYDLHGTYLVIDSLSPAQPDDRGFLKELVSYARSKGYDNLLLRASRGDGILSAYDFDELGKELFLEDIALDRSDFFPTEEKTLRWISQLPDAYTKKGLGETYTSRFLLLYGR